MTPQNKKNIEKKLSYKFKKLIESYNSKRLLLEQVDTSHCKGQNFLLPITDEEYNRIPKGNDGKILFCKYKTPMGPMFIKANSGFSLSKGMSDTQLNDHYKKYNITDREQRDKIKNDSNIFLGPGVLSSFNDGTKYTLNLQWKWDGQGLPTVYSLGYIDPQGNPYKGPVFDKVKPVSPENIITNLFTEYTNWKNDKKYWDEALEKKEFLKILDDDGNVKEDVNLSDEEIKRAKEQFEVYKTKESQGRNELIERLADATLEQLPEFKYVKFLSDGKVEQLNSPPKEMSSEYGGKYVSEPPYSITEANTEKTFQVKNPEIDDSNKYGISNWEYKEYFPPIQIRKEIIDSFANTNVESQMYEKIVKDELNNNPILLRLFSPEDIQKSLSECATNASYDFLVRVIQGKVLGPNGIPVGYYFMKNGVKTLEKYVPPFGVGEYGGIPCEDAFMNEYGLPIQMLVGLVAGILYPVGGWVFYSALLADVLVNAYSLTKSMKAQDEGRAKLDIAYMLLPFLVETSAFRGLINQTKFGAGYKATAEKLTQSLEALKMADGTYDLVQLRTFVDNLGEKEAKLLNHLGKKEFKNALRAGGKEINNLIKPKAKMSTFRRTLDTSSSILFYGLPSAVHILDGYLNKIEDTLGETLTDHQYKFFQFILSHMSQVDRDKMYRMKKEQLLEFEKKSDELAQKYAEQFKIVEQEKAEKEGQEKIDKEIIRSYNIQDLTCEEILQSVKDLAKKYGLTINCRQLDPSIKSAVENEKKELESKESNN